MRIYYRAHMNSQVIVSWIEAALYASMIILLSSMSQPGYILTKVPLHTFDKVVHFFEYAVFGFILLRAFAVTYDYPGWWRLAISVFLFGAAFGLGDEIYQGFVPQRTSSLADAAVDAVGFLFGMAVWVPARRLARVAFVRRRMYLYRKGAYAMKRLLSAFAILGFVAMTLPSNAEACGIHKSGSGSGAETTTESGEATE